MPLCLDSVTQNHLDSSETSNIYYIVYIYITTNLQKVLGVKQKSVMAT